MDENTAASVHELTENDIPGAILHEPLESATVHALRWWLLCHGIQPPTSWRKAKLIEKVRSAKEAGAKVVDVDGSYLHRKQAASTTTSDSDPDQPPPAPLAGWESVDSAASVNVQNIPKVTHGLLYTYLADCVGRGERGEAFRSLQRGFNHWSSGRLSKVEINFRHPKFCHVCCQVTPSMKQGLYHVYILLGCEGEVATIRAATCECAAGKSASCTHVSALLHALASLTVAHVQHVGDIPVPLDDGEALPITSYLCQWNAPRKRKESNMPISEAVFQKHVYGRQRKRELKPIEDFDPRPLELRGKSMEHLKTYLSKVRGQGLGVSLLFDEECRCWSTTTKQPLAPVLPTKEELRVRVEEFKKSLCMSPHQLWEIEQSTREQSQSSLWHSVRRYRITASYFGSIFRRKPTTPPQSLVLQILGAKPFTSAATEWGKRNEAVALEQYKKSKNDSGHHGLYYSPSGFVVCESHPFLGASPDAVVHDPTDPSPFSLAEVKCPYSFCNQTPFEAAKSRDFCCQLELNSSGSPSLKLKRTHPYFCQVQGQMAITERKWCDFVVYTPKGVSIECIPYDPEFWTNELLPKLTMFYDNCLGPEIVCPVHVLGLPVRNIQ